MRIKITTLQGLLTALLLNFSLAMNAQYEWSNITVPANAGSGNSWNLVESLSDDFSYSSSFGSGGYANRSNFGSNNQWYNFYHNAWDGPGYTYWNTSNVSVDGDNLVITAGHTAQNSKGGPYGVASGCVTSNSKVTYPVYVESSVSVANISLASCFWLLSPDDTEEIDIIENYGGVDFFENFTHISHHSFVRAPFTDYQPRDWNSWHKIDEITNAGGWGEFCWNGGNRRYMRMGVNWIGPKHWEYYINGDLVRVMYYNAMASKVGNSWEYTYYNSTFQDTNGYYFPTNGADGYSLVTTHATENSYNFSTLEAASNASNGFSVIDTGWFQGGDDDDVDENGVTQEAKGFTKSLDIIINIESQTWLQSATPSQADLNDQTRNKMLVDWVRVYKPVSGGGNTNVAVTGVNLTPATLSLNVGATGNLTGAVVPSNATDKTMTFSSNNTSVATVNQSGVVTAVAAGTAVITASTTDGGKTDTSTITVTGGGSNSPANGQTPFGGTARAIPGVINSVDFDNGGEGVAYHDTTSGNTGPGARQNTNVDTENRVAAGNVGWIATGEWLEYTVNVATAGIYNINVQVASTNNNGAFHIEFNGVNVTGNQSVSSTGNWGTFQDTTISNVSLAAGQQVMRVFMDGGSFNLGSMSFTANGGSTGGGNSTVAIEAESFSRTGGTFNDGFVPLGVNKTNTTINYVNTGDWAEYAITIPEDGAYEITYSISSPITGSTIGFGIGTNIWNTTIVPNNGNWDSYQDLKASATANFTAGNHIIRLTAGAKNWTWNLDKFTLKRISAMNLKVALDLDNVLGNLDEELRIYPNPVQSELHFQNVAGYHTANIYNLVGVQVLSKKLEANYLNLSNLTDGIYMLELISDTKTEMKKIVVKH